MFTVYSKSKRDGAAWVWVNDFDDAITATQVARHLVEQGHEVSIDDGLTVERDSPYAD